MSALDLLVLGGSGRVGRLLRRGFEPLRQEGRVVVQARNAAPWVDLVSGAEDVALDAELKNSTPRAMVVFWGVTPGADSEEMSLNTALVLRALELARTARCPHVVLMSSSAIYGAPGGSEILEENTRLAPSNVYGVAKRDMEQAALAWWDTCPADERPSLSILRLANVIGCDMLGTAIARATVDNPLVLDRFSDGWGARRSYLGPSFLLAAIRAVARRSRSEVPVVFNLADNRTGFAMHSILEAFAQSGHSVPWIWRSAPASAIPAVILDTTRFASTFPETVKVGCQTEAALVSDFLAAKLGPA